MLGIIFLLLTGCITLAYLLYRHRKKVQILKETLADLKEVQEIKEIKASLEGRDQERIRIAKDWHDGIGNSLSALRLIIDTIQPKNQAAHTETLSLLEHTQREFRQIIDNELMHDFADESAIVKTFSQWQQRLQLGNINLNYKVYDLLLYNTCSLEIKAHLYRIAQELLTNTIKHAQAKEVEIVLKEKEKYLLLSVTDDGIGWNLENQAKNGLRSVKERLSLLKGTIQIDSIINSGTKIEVSIPF